MRNILRSLTLAVILATEATQGKLTEHAHNGDYDHASANRLGNTKALHGADSSPWLNRQSEPFAVNRTGLPGVPFDIGESYAGLLPISDDPKEPRQLFFWFFPSQSGNITDEITLWLNGGPGCSSLVGLTQENGPFLFQDGTAAPVRNPYAWNKLTNMIWVEQPVPTGFSQGNATALNELDVADQFRGFWKNLVRTFPALEQSKIYMTGESYAGQYVPYIANGFLTANDTKYYNLKGISINDPIIGDYTLQTYAPAFPFVEYWSNVLSIDSATIAHLRVMDQENGMASYRDKYFQFPPPPQPWPALPKDIRNASRAIDHAIEAANPCYNPYHISDSCPQLSSVLLDSSRDHSNLPGTTNYFRREDVQRAIHAPVGSKWEECGAEPFPHDDNTDGPVFDDTLRNIIAKTRNVMIGSGALDGLLPTNGTLFALQNYTWGGDQGFHSYPSTPIFIPYHDSAGAIQGSYGNVGTWTKERDLTFYIVQAGGHQVPQYAPSAGYRMLQILLGRVEDFSSKASLLR